MFSRRNSGRCHVGSHVTAILFAQNTGQGNRLLASKFSAIQSYTQDTRHRRGAIRSAGIAIQSVVIVDIAVGVHIPCIVGVAPISRTQPTIPGPIVYIPLYTIRYSAYRLASDSIQPRILLRTSIVFFPQYWQRFPLR